MQKARFGRISRWGAIAFASGIFVVCGVAGAGSFGETSSVSREGVSATDLSGILAAHISARHAVVSAAGGGHEALNSGQRWRTTFDGRGFCVTPARASFGNDWSWGLNLVSYGFAGHERVVSAPEHVHASGNRLTYEWDAVLSEWYVNDERGLEHGFTVRERPTGGAGPLQFKIEVRGDLCADVQRGGRDVRFMNASDSAILNYAGLTVFDALGAQVPARFEEVPGGMVLSVDECGAQYPLTIDPVAQQAYIKASNTGVGDNFGFSVSIDGDTAVIGATGESSNATGVNGNQANNGAVDSGAAYVFVRNGGVWSQQAYLKASNTEASDSFGHSVAIDGDTIVVGAMREDSGATGVNGNQVSNGASNSGAAYVFVRNGGVWSQQAYLKASNAEASDEFGRSVAIDGDTVVIGAWHEDSDSTGVNGNQGSNAASNSGAAYVFVRNGGAWTQQAYLKASNTEASDEFGRSSVAIAGDTVVVGAFGEDSNATGVNGDQLNNSASNSGATYVFVRQDGVWTQQAYLKASNTGTTDSFGYSADVDGDTLVVGAYGEDSNATGVNGNQANNSIAGSGAVYCFVRANGVWSQQAYIKASNTGNGDNFGIDVAIDGDLLLVGASGEDGNATGVNGDQVNNGANQSGAAYAFVCENGIWSQTGYLKAPDTDPLDSFGEAVALSGATGMVGFASEDSSATGVDGNPDNDAVANSGAVVAFDLDAPLIGADLNDDGVINGADLVIVLGSWGPCAGCDGDINDDGVVDGGDIAIVLGDWTLCPAPPVPPTEIDVMNSGCAVSNIWVTLAADGGSGATVEWFMDECGGGIPFATGSQIQVFVNTPTTFYARWSTICEASACVSRFIDYVEPVAPDSVTAFPSAEICPGESTTLTANGGGGLQVLWYELPLDPCNEPGQQCGSVHQGTTFVVSPTRTTTYCARWVGSCSLYNFSSCVQFTVTVKSCE